MNPCWSRWMTPRLNIGVPMSMARAVIMTPSAPATATSSGAGATAGWFWRSAASSTGGGQHELQVRTDLFGCPGDRPTVVLDAVDFDRPYAYQDSEKIPAAIPKDPARLPLYSGVKFQKTAKVELRRTQCII